MKIVFGWRRLTPPAFIGGAELTEAEMAVLCRSLGHEVSFVGSFENPRSPAQSLRGWLENLLSQSSVEWSPFGSGLRYFYHGIDCLSVEQSVLERVLATEIADADIFVTSQEDCVALAALAPRAVRIYSYVHSASEVGLSSTRIPTARLLAPSIFIQRKIFETSGRSSVLARTPLVIADRRRALHPNPSEILFVNPVRSKGLDVVLSIARSLPHLRFRFVETWQLYDGPAAPPNVEIVPKTLDLDTYYKSAIALLVPSIVEDASPRVIGEASRFAVPSLGTPVGGIPELIFDGSLLLPRDRLDTWCERICAISHDEKLREGLGASQLRHARKVYAEPGTEMLRRVGLA